MPISQSLQIAVLSATAQAPLLVVTFGRAGFQVTALDNKVTIVGRAPMSDEAALGFADLAGITLNALGDQNLSAYGFNVDFTFEGEPIVDILQIKYGIRDIVGWRLSQMIGHFVFRKEGNPRITMDIGDSDSGSTRKKAVYVNVHYETCSLSALGAKVAIRYNEAVQHASDLAKGAVCVG